MKRIIRGLDSMVARSRHPMGHGALRPDKNTLRVYLLPGHSTPHRAKAAPNSQGKNECHFCGGILH
jgi:hypothetical protein